MKQLLTDSEYYSNDLLFTSELQPPFFISYFESRNTFENFVKITRKIRLRDVDHFFETTVKIRPGYSQEEIENAQKFIMRVKFIKENLKNATVYWLGKIRVTICIAGETKQGILVVLSTTVSEKGKKPVKRSD